MTLKSKMNFSLCLVALLAFNCSDDTVDTGDVPDTGGAPDTGGTDDTGGTGDTGSAMTFFLTSVGPGDGANLGGLDGADAHCTSLAEAAGTTGQEWRAYLSTTGAEGVNAMDRIGTGPWINADGVTIATDVDDLLSDDNNINQDTAISESGEIINGIGDSPNRHDILTGTELDGTAADDTCSNWTSNDLGTTLVGHHDRDGGGANPESWSSAHGTAGCSQADLISTAGDGLFYCFATN